MVCIENQTENGFCLHCAKGEFYTMDMVFIGIFIDKQ